MNDLARHLEHTLLRSDATAAEIRRLCEEARTHRFHAVCVNGSRVELARHLVDDADVQVVAAVGFPLGAMDSGVKVHETEAARDAGAQEIDVVLNIGRLKDGEDRYVLRELRDIVEAAEGLPVKGIIEACLLTEDEKVRACRLIMEAEARFVKTSTGFNRGGATVDDVRLLRATVGAGFGVKAAGGIRTWAAATALLAAGADRLGTSCGVGIVTDPAAL